MSFRCEAGEIVAVLGGNGAGKSTLLAIAAGLLLPTGGSVGYGDGGAAGEHRGSIGLVGHDLFLYPELTAAENLTFYGRLHGISDVDRRVDAALARAGLSERRDEPLTGFSRGMRQRVALERALLHEPRLVLLDEPFTGLDDAACSALVRRIMDLRDSGCLVLVATHDLEIIEGVITRAVLLRDGKLVPIAAGSGTLRERFRQAGH